MAITKGKLIARPDLTEIDGDSVVSYLADGSGNLLSSTSGALDVSVTNASIAVTATDLDIRDLAFATDKVDVSGSSVSITGDVNVTQGTSPWVVSATDLDIRNLVAATDSVSISDGTDALAINADGSINVVGTFTINGQYAEDSAHSSGAIGLYNLAVRADAPAVATSADGDYASQTVDAYNRSWVNTGANVAIANAAATVTTTTGLLIASAAGRRKILVQNNGTKNVFFGASGVSAANGVKLPAGANVELEIGPALALHAVAESGSQDVRVLQLS